MIKVYVFITLIGWWGGLFLTTPQMKTLDASTVLNFPDAATVSPKLQLQLLKE